MFTMLVSIFTYFMMLGIWATAAAIICIYIFRNSRKYQMNSLFWVIIGLVFNLPGLCAYLIARKKVCRAKCPACMADTPEEIQFCQNCGINLEDARPKMKFLPKLLLGIGTSFVIFQVISLLFTSLYSS